MGRTPEQEFLDFAHSEPEFCQSVLPRLPLEIFSPEGRQDLQKLLEGLYTPVEPSASRDRALGFLGAQLSALVAARALTASRNGHGGEQLQAAYRLWEEVKDGIEPLPIVKFKDRIPGTREVIPTGIEALDEQIQGLARGGLGVVGLPSGFGKTCIMIGFAVNALLDAKNVLYITVADQGFNELAPRFATNILETPCPPDATAEVLAARHQEAMERFSGTLWIADFTDRVCMLSDIERSIRLYPCDLVIVDHADDIQNDWSTDPTVTRHSLRATYMALKRMATQYQVPIWTGSQTHEFSWNLGYSGVQGLAEAKNGKASGSEIVILCTGGVTPEPGIMLMHIAKARRAYRERTVRVQYDFSICRVW